VAEKFKAMRGTHDILPDEAPIWRRAETIFAEVAARYGYAEIRVPIFEATELFERGTGFATDVVQKEMYTFEDKKGRRLSLRPEATPSVIRAYLEHGLARKMPVAKFFYMGPMFRYDKPGAGRYRQFHQIGVEVVGTASPVADAEVITLLWQYLKALELTRIGVRLNTLGCKPCRVKYSGVIKDFLKDRLGQLCGDCNERFARNPLRVLDCKVASCKAVLASAPEIGTILCEECVRHFERVQALLGEVGIPFSLDPKLVRGLDYYTRTVFEVFHEAVGLENSVGGGGRYDHLVEEVGGPSTPAVGFSAGMERIVLGIQAEQSPEAGAAGAAGRAGAAGSAGPGSAAGAASDRVEVFVAAIGERAFLSAFKLAAGLRERWKVWLEFDPRKVDRQLGSAARLGAGYTVIIGEDEIAKGLAKIKDMTSGEQVEVGADSVAAWLADRTAGDRPHRR
jgi:histidyl-tRNA synthetase